MSPTRSRSKRISLQRLTRRGQYCSPSRGKHGGSCFTRSELIRIAAAWNKSHNVSEHIATHRHCTGGKIWNDINERMKSECTSEYCWTQRPVVASHDPYISETLVKESFRPEMPMTWKTNPNEWLSATDIQMVLAQYERVYRGFKFIGAIPVDFASQDDSGRMGHCIVQELCNINVRQWMKQGTHKIGIVFNMDAHDSPGSHWTSMYVDLKANQVLYYDSFGDRPPSEVADLIQILMNQMEHLHGEHPIVRINEARHQFKNTECGVYSIYFIVHMLEHKQHGYDHAAMAYDKYVTDGLNDKQMNRYRKVFFRVIHGDETGITHGGSSFLGWMAGGGKTKRQRRRNRIRLKKTKK